MKKIVTTISLQVLVIVVIALINLKVNFIQIPSIEDFSKDKYNLFTVVSVLAGFMFTVLGILVSTNGSNFVEKLKGTNIVYKKAKIIGKGIVTFCISGGLIIIFILKSSPEFNEAIFSFIYLFIYGFLLIGLYYFIRSTFEVYDLIKRIFKVDTEQYDEQRENYQKRIEELKN